MSHVIAQSVELTRAVSTNYLLEMCGIAGRGVCLCVTVYKHLLCLLAFFWF